MPVKKMVAAWVKKVVMNQARMISPAKSIMSIPERKDANEFIRVFLTRQRLGSLHNIVRKRQQHAKTNNAIAPCVVIDS